MNKKSDGEIKEHVLRELKWDSRTTWSEIGVEVFEGVVTLTGTVDSYAKKRVAAATPFGFMPRFATDMERLFEDSKAFAFRVFSEELFPFTREFEHVGWVPEIEVLRKNGEFMIREIRKLARPHGLEPIEWLFVKTSLY